MKICFDIYVVNGYIVNDLDLLKSFFFLDLVIMWLIVFNVMVVRFGLVFFVVVNIGVGL